MVPHSGLWVLALSGLSLLVACDASSISAQGGDPTGDGPLGSFMDAPLADGRSGCAGAIDCTGGQVCNPATGQCTTTLGCRTHTDCGHQAYCTPAGTCAVNTLYGPCDTSDGCVGGETCIGGHCGCGGELLTATAVAPDMLIALDRSGSMDGAVPGTRDSRWTVAQRAIKALTQKYQARIRFGLVLWPGTNLSCGGSQAHCEGVDPAVSLGLDSGGAIASYLDTAGRCMLGTPIGGTLTALGTHPGLADATRANYVVLVTDGGENCNGDGPAAATALRRHTPEVKTFAVGFGGDVDKSVLTDIARNGGTARSGPTPYYQADDEATLLAAFDDIAGSIVSCTYVLSKVPEDPSRLFVYLGTTAVSRDTTHRTGWDYDAVSKQLAFYGATCDLVRTGAGGALSISFGCAIIP